MRKFLISMVAVVLLVAVSVTLVACIGDKKYFEMVDSYTFWDNEGKQAIPQTAVGQIVDAHMTNTAGGKTKKVAVLGYDGCRADALVNIINSGVKEVSGYDDYSGKLDDSYFSGINAAVGETGGVYISYAGGEKGKSSQQHTSTAPGWAAITTGVWGEKNGVTNNSNDNDKMIKNLDYKTFMLKGANSEYNSTKYSSAFYSQWGDHFENQYKLEIGFLLEKNRIADLKALSAKDNATAGMAVPMIYKQIKGDVNTYLAMKNAVTEGSEFEKDIVFGILEATDYNGHETEFGNHNYKYAVSARAIDAYYYDVVQTIYNRPSYASEDWLIILTTDHGGIKTWHGGQTLEERTTFIACNKKIDAKYFSSNYDGYVNNK